MVTRTRKISAFALCVLFHSLAGSQGSLLIRESNGHRTAFPGSSIVNQSYLGKSLVATHVVDLNEEVHIVVVLKTPPLSSVKPLLGKAPIQNVLLAAANVRDEHSRFLTDLRGFESGSPGTVNGPRRASRAQIRFDYRTAINGFAMTTTRWRASQIRGLSYVRGVYPDNKVHTTDDGSNHQVGADSVWSRAGLTGKGVLIGLVDTGIDYTHPELGGGIGPSFKVVGGFDFVNNDADPMDDNGHGTHVAGIVAANGPMLKGVAPDAKLMAFKVLDSRGDGDISDVISGIERALDPDQNPVTNDAVDIINLSLTSTSPGDPDDPLSQAVDNATGMGVLCVVGAGNTGPGYQTMLGSPACARSALTVGAVDSHDAIAWFSSRGPAPGTFGIKPDIVAPGVQILSAAPGGGYVRLSGTSQATPHVAGVAALLSQRRADRNPLLLKSLLMESAHDLGTDAFTYGAGRVDALKAVGAQTSIVPGSVSFGIVDIGQSTWVTRDTLEMYNFSGENRAYTFRVTGLPTGADVTVTPRNASVPSSGSAQVVIALSVDNFRVPFTSGDPPGYFGRLIAASVVDTVSVVLGFIKNPLLNITLNEYPKSVRISNAYSSRFISFPPDLSISLLLPKGTYDVAANLDDFTWVIREGVNVDSVNFLPIRREAAKNAISLQLVGPAGNSMGVSSWSQGIFSKKHNWSSFTSAGINGQVDSVLMHISDLSDSYEVSWKAESFAYGGTVVGNSGKISRGLSSDTTIINKIPEMKHVQFRYDNVAPEFANLYPVLWYGSSAYRPEINPLTSPFVQDVYLQPDAGASDFLPTYGEVYAPTPGTGELGLVLETPRMHILNRDTALLGHPFTLDTLSPDRGAGIGIGRPLNSLAHDPLELRSGPPHWYGMLDNTSSGVKFSVVDEGAIRFFYNQMEDWTKDTTIAFRLTRGDVVVDSGLVYDHLSIPTVPDLYTLEIPYQHYRIQGIPGAALARLSFDTRRPDKNPPGIAFFHVLSGGRISDIIPRSETGSVRFSLVDDGRIGSVAFQYASSEDTSWHTLGLTVVDTAYQATIPSNLPDGPVRLRLVAQDLSANTLEYTMNPGLWVGSSVVLAPPALNLPPPKARTVELLPRLVWSRVGTATHYHILISGTSSFSNNILDLQGIKDTAFQVTDSLGFNRVCFWKVAALNDFGGQVWSSVGTFTTRPRLMDFDTYVRWSTPDENPGASTELFIPSEWGDTVNSYIRFDVSRVPADSIVADARIAFYAFGNGDFGRTPGPMPQCGVFEVLDPWDDLGMTWSRQPRHQSAPAASFNLQIWNAGQWNAIPGLDSLVRKWIRDPATNHGVVFRSLGGLAGFVGVYSLDYPDSAYRPRLIVKYRNIDGNQGIPPPAFSLAQNYPNPFNPSTTIRYTLPAKTHVSLTLFNTLGQQVALLVNDTQDAGSHDVRFDGSGLASGVYFYRLRAGGIQSTRRLALVR